MFRSPRAKVLAIVAGVVLVAGIALGAFLLLRDDAPEEADIADAGQTLDDEGLEAASVDDIAGYRIDEELGGGIGAQTAAGRTGDVTGSVTIADGEVTEANFEVDMTTLVSSDERRDNQLKGRGLETDAFPTAGFELTEPVALPADAVTGDQLTFSAPGELTLHGVTQPVTIQLQADLREGLIAIVGDAPIVLTDYEISPPTGGFVVSVADQGSLEFQLFLEPA